MTGDKAHVRRAALTARTLLSHAQRADAAEKIADELLPVAWAAAVVAAYIPLPDEPGSIALLDSIAEHSTLVVPVMMSSRELDWVVWSGAEDLVPSGPGGRLLRPIGPSLGVGYLAAADLIVVPALRVAHSGHRLGRGGGSYDRALPRARRDAMSVALLFDGELTATVPADPWDVPVRAAITPGSGWTNLPVS